MNAIVIVGAILLVKFARDKTRGPSGADRRAAAGAPRPAGRRGAFDPSMFTELPESGSAVLTPGEAAPPPCRRVECSESDRDPGYRRVKCSDGRTVRQSGRC